MQPRVVQSVPVVVVVVDDEVATRCSKVEPWRQPHRGQPNTHAIIHFTFCLQTVGLISALHLRDLAFRGL